METYNIICLNIFYLMYDLWMKKKTLEIYGIINIKGQSQRLRRFVTSVKLPIGQKCYVHNCIYPLDDAINEFKSDLTFTLKNSFTYKNLI